MSETRTNAGGLSIATVLHDFVDGEALPGSGLSSDAFWKGFGDSAFGVFRPQPGAAGQTRRACRRKSMAGTPRIKASCMTPRRTRIF